MKRIFTLAAIAATTLTFAQNGAQDKTNVEPGHVLSANLTASNPGQFGISYEREGKSFFYKDSNKSSSTLNLSLGAMLYEVGNYEFIGGGYIVEVGNRTYYGKQGEQFKGFYSANSLSYGSIEFDDTDAGAKIDGTYSYFSFFSPEIGYKIRLGNFVIDPFIGAQWKIEIKGKGDIDNHNVDEWAFRGGLKIGYKF
ncbi:MAG: hypothetical protein BM557_09475 [Flavobacterium sp. MedPE-SWcel]|uniref:hypothetical protein n=1 Tax=uncultured Flavobacterium sp. TaxID=165435 RepID=UPI0009180898|nr:hypothetical protein [uncultured Flavobacterium sp.]OIQ16963.1 MAG: hypothetical protein BM557_09475 [Flavobacterium sp. MedPE-SWcel]